MLLNIVHQTTYRYDQSLPYALQRVRLIPRTDALQTVDRWDLSYEGAREEVRFVDHFGNQCRLLSTEPGAMQIVITARGQVTTRDQTGVAGQHTGFAPLWLFERETPLTMPSAAIGALSEPLGGPETLGLLHDLMDTIQKRVAYVSGSTTSETTADEALAAGQGVCQDHAHIFISAVRTQGLPARYVSGYLMMDDTTQQVATHAWAEAHVPGLGWVGFDVSNGICPDERYVRVAFGRDYRDAMPVAGIRQGQAHEQLEVHVTVEQ
jgi:transglutaminase-like putative cysteine protease